MELILSSKKILILGKYKSGFLASNLIEFFKRKNYEVCYDNNTDLRSLEDGKLLFGKMRPEIVVQAAAYTSGILDIINRPWYHINDNSLMNSNVLQLCHLYKVKHFIFLSCCVMYNMEHKNLFPTIAEETDLINPYRIKTEYLGVASMKVFAENLCLFYSKKYGLKTTIVRHTNTFGPYDHFKEENNHVIPALIDRINNEKKQIEIWGNPKNKKNLIYVKDVCRFVEYAIDNQKTNYEIFNLGGQNITILNLVKLILLVSRKKLEIITNDDKLKNFGTQNQPNISFNKVKNFGFKKNYTLAQGLRETWNWYSNIGS